MDVYGQKTPPEIDLTKISIPVALYVGEDDQIADKRDNDIVNETIPNVIEYKVLEN